MQVTDSDATLTVIDGGARYGIHPSWRVSDVALDLRLFEPDADEAARLTSKYVDRPDITVEALALGPDSGETVLNRLAHRGQSSQLSPLTDSLWFDRVRPGEGKIDDSVTVSMTSLDAYCDGQDIVPDFLKLDTEGTELAILRGAELSLDQSVLGVRCETHFDAVYEGQSLFHDVHGFLLSRGFYLLNLDYDGRGVARGPFVDEGRYGTLLGADGLWLRRDAVILMRGAMAAFKAAYFCLRNHAADVAIDLLQRSRDRHSRDYEAVLEGSLGRAVAGLIGDHLYRVKHLPGRGEPAAAELFRTLTGLAMPVRHEYFEAKP